MGTPSTCTITRGKLLDHGASPGSKAGRPPHPGKRHPPFGIEPYAFTLPKLLLDQLRARDGADADPPAGIDHPVPGYSASFGQRMQRVAHLAGVTGQAGERGNLPIRGDVSSGDASDHVVNSLVGHLQSGAAFHPGGQEHDAGHQRSAADPCWDCAFLFH